jgi:RecG-like helicase
MQLSQQLEECEWVPKARLTPLRRLGIHTVEDLVTHFPRRHEDRREFAGFPRDESEVPICICGEGGEDACDALRRLQEDL